MTSAQPETQPGPPKVFALTARPDGELLVGTFGRGLRMSSNRWRDWTASPAAPFGVNTLERAQDGRLYAGTVGRGVMTSVDGGERWTELGVGLSGTTVNAVLACAGGTLAGTDGKGVAWLGPDGTEWAWLDADGLGTVYRLVSVAGTVLAATLERGVRSVNVPGQPQDAISQLEGQTAHALLSVPTGVFAGTSGAGLHRSIDGGRSWRRLMPDVIDPVVHCLAANGSTMLAGTAAGVFASADGGRTWQETSEGLASRRIFSVAVTTDGRLVAGGYDGVWTSAAVAARWTPLPTGLTAPEVYAVTVEPSGQTLAGGHGQLWRSDDDGATWTSWTVGLAGRVIYGISTTAGGRRYLATDDGVLAETTDGTWAPAGLPGCCVLAVAAGANGLFAATLGSGLWVSADDGRAWERVAAFTCPTATDVRSTAAGVLATGLDARSGPKTGGVFRADATGKHWQRLNAPQLASYRVAEAPDGRLYVGAQRSTILRSGDSGRSWQSLPTTGLVDCKLYALTVAPDGRVFIGTDGGVLVSADHAVTWQYCHGDAVGTTPYSLSVTRRGTVIAGTSQGLRTWTEARRVDR